MLDVGAAQGFLGESLRETGLTIDAVEANARWADHARPFYRQVFACSIESAPLPRGTYRTIVCADVLEHLVDPGAVLKRLRDAATDDAVFIVSVPNVAHLSVRLMLLLGRFPQMERGILDRGHLHFYTRSTAQELLTRNGLSVRQAVPTVVPPDELEQASGLRCLAGPVSLLQGLCLRIAPKLFAYQWIFVASPIGADAR